MHIERARGEAVAELGNRPAPLGSLECGLMAVDLWARASLDHEACQTCRC